MSSSSNDASAGEIRTVRFSDALEERYLTYALSTIMARSLPDVRDGLKPVHRRLLYGMRQLRLNPDQGFKKSARVVGDVMGQFHPHGDQAIYDALVRLSQDFSLRYPLVDGQGNFGNIDGDNAAAMRYTEARLTEFAMSLLEGIDEDTVDFRPTYTGEDLEPAVLPASLPNLLANGAQGIAVGMGERDPAAQPGRAVRCPDPPDQASQGDDRQAGRAGAGPRLPNRRRAGRGPGRHRRGLQNRPRRVPATRPLAYGKGQGRRLRGDRDRDPLSGSEVALGGENRRTAVQPEAGGARRRSRRIGGRGAPGAGAQEPQRGSGRTHGVAVPPDRPGEPHLAQHERAGRGPHAPGHEPARGALRLPRPSPGRPAAPHPTPSGADHQAPRNSRRLSDRLSQHRRGDPHHPPGGRAQGGHDEALQAERDPGGRDPKHAPAVSPQARGRGHQEGARRAHRRAGRPQETDEGRGPALEGDRRADRRDQGSASAGTRRSAAGARSWARRRATLSCLSRRWSSASR